MPCLLNQERVILESLEYTRLKTAQVLRCDPCHVEVRGQFEGGKLAMKIQILQETLFNTEAMGSELEEIKEAMAAVRLLAKEAMSERLAGLDERHL